jgi:hypothetical protein
LAAVGGFRQKRRRRTHSEGNMTDAAISPERFDMGRVIGRTFGVIGRNFATFFGLSVVLAGAPQIVVGLLTFYTTRDALSGAEALGPETVGLLIVSFVVLLVSSCVLQAAIIHNAVSDLSGRKASFGASLATGIRYFLPLFVVAILSGLATALGFMLLIVPGVILSVMWSVITPALVVDRAGIMGSFERSAELTRGRRWSIFGLIVIYAIFVFAVGIVFEIPGQVLLAMSEGGVLAYYGVISPLQAAVQSLVGAAGVAALYVELRQLKEGIGVDALAAVFD